MRTLTAVVIGALVAVPVLAQEQPRDHVKYEEKYKDPVIEEMRKANEAARKEAEKVTEEILDRLAAEKKEREEAEPKLRFDLEGLVRPESPDSFSTHLWHLPPVPQYYTGTCWSFSTISFLESEVHRITGQEIKLSEMWVAYWEYVAKARGFVESRGQTMFEEGSESAAVLRVARERGLVPRADYEGVLSEDGRFNHGPMHEAMQEFLGWCRDANFWDEEIILAMIQRILDSEMGAPPANIMWNGLEYRPTAFVADILKLNPNDYVELMSTLSKPFWTRAVYEVPDNWWRGAEYVNVPLDTWYGVIGQALERGYTVAIGGDVSEPGLNGHEDVAVIPTFDIPGEWIDQDSRELRFANGTTTDDHGVHLVGHTTLDGHDWFLIKDSNRSSRHGEFEGYYFYRDDYVKLKMLTLMVHRDVVPDILAKLE